MSFASRARTMGLVLCAGQGVAACAENTPDHLDFALPTSTIDISSRDPQWRSAPATLVPTMVCGGPQALSTDCCSPPAPASPVDCTQYPLACDPNNHLCALTFDVDGSAQVSLNTDAPEVAAVDGRVFARVSLLALTTSVTTPEVLPIRNANLFIAPTDAGGSSSASAVLLGPVALTTEDTAIVVSAAAQQVFSDLARQYRVPFSLWISAHVVAAGGSAPAGSVSFRVSGRARAWY
jgi:hypothetical protein